MIGTAINVGAVVGGSTIGLLVGARLSEKMRATALTGIGLVCCVIGLQMALGTKNILVVLGAILAGAVIGESLGIEDALNRLGDFLQSKLSKGEGGGFTEGFVTASLVYCVGPMAILGAIQDGISGDYQLLAVKSMLDGFASIAFAASLGWGVVFSAVSVLLYQGVITLAATGLEKVLSEPMIIEMTSTGGVIIVAIGLKLLDVKEMRLANFLPALVIAPLIVEVIRMVQASF